LRTRTPNLQNIAFCEAAVIRGSLIKHFDERSAKPQ